MSGIQQLLLGGSPAGYQIERSLRFNSADSAYLNRTFGTPTGTTKGTWSGWVKRGTLGTQQVIFSSSNFEFFEFQSTDKIRISNIDGNAYWVTTQVFRDPSAWYHLVIAWDSTLATATDRCKFWVNGVRVTQWDSQPTITQNTTFARWNVSGYSGSIGRFDFNGTLFLSAYQTEIYWVDGQALTPSSFGQTNANTGVWEPVKYTGTYGTNGFYLNFSDNSNTTAATLGKDSSGNGNNWTPNNFSVTAGVGNDSLVDTPTSYGTDTGVGGEVRGNYATWNPLAKSLLTGTFTFSNGNLDVSDAASSYGAVLATLGASSGKWYWEVTCVSSGGSSGYIGIVPSSATDPTVFGYPGAGGSYSYSTNGQKFTSNSGTTYGATYTTGDIIGVALDLDAGTLVFYKNGSSQGTAFSSLSGSFVPSVGDGAGATQYSWTANFGQRPFAYTAPSGFKALCTQNLPTPTIGATSTTQANRYFDIQLYTGTGSSRSVTGYNFQPEFVWIKGRSGATDHGLYDAVRGVQLDLVSNSTAAETTQSTGLTAFNSDGFTVGSLAKLNTNTATYVAWAWDAADSNSTNTSGTITSTVRANTTAGFSIVTYTGNATTDATIGHGLGVTPQFFVVKNRSTTSEWLAYHVSTGKNGYMQMQSTAAFTSSSNYWGSTGPTSTTIQINGGGGVNNNGSNYVCYAFAPVAGYSAFGSYTGNGSTDGPFVFTGHRPRYVLIKRATGGVANWELFDTARDTYNQMGNQLYANLSSAEYVDNNKVDFLSNGIKIRSNQVDLNNNGDTYIYAAFAENPFKYSLAR